VIDDARVVVEGELSQKPVASGVERNCRLEGIKWTALMDLLLAASSGSKHKEFTRTICYYSKGNTTLIPIEESLVTSVDQPSAPGRCLVVPFILLLCPCHLRSLLFVVTYTR